MEGLFTKRSLIPYAVAQKIPRADSRELRVTCHEAFSLSALSNTRGTDQDDAGGALELLRGDHSGERWGCATKPGRKDRIQVSSS